MLPFYLSLIDSFFICLPKKLKTRDSKSPTQNAIFSLWHNFVSKEAKWKKQIPHFWQHFFRINFCPSCNFIKRFVLLLPKKLRKKPTLFFILPVPNLLDPSIYIEQRRKNWGVKKPIRAGIDLHSSYHLYAPHFIMTAANRNLKYIIAPNFFHLKLCFFGTQTENFFFQRKKILYVVCAYNICFSTFSQII